ncbi:MAG: hypothetical protein ACTSRU_04145 [Candidatus Hodarchaeales archaeon]
MLDNRDIIIPTSKIGEFVRYNEHVPRILAVLDGKTTVEELIAGHGANGEVIREILDYLLVKEAIEIVSAEKRKIILAKEIMRTCLEIAERVFSKKEVIKKLARSLERSKYPEIQTSVRLTDNKWTIENSLIIYDKLPPDVIIKIYKFGWIELIKTFIISFEGKKRKKLINALSSSLGVEFLEKYRIEDIDGLEEFTNWLETIIQE